MRVGITGFLHGKWARVLGTSVAFLAFAALVVHLGHARNLALPQYLPLVVDGLRGGAIYALVALGFVTVFNVTGIINFAQGGFVMLGAMLCVTFFNMPLLRGLAPALRMSLSVLLSILLVAGVGALMERLTIWPARRSPALTLTIITVGVYTVMWGAALLFWGASPYQLPAFSTLQQKDQILRFGQVVAAAGSSWTLGGTTLPAGASFIGVTVKAQSLWIWGVTAAILGALAYFFERTLLGKALRACAVNRRAAQLVGIRASRMSLLSFVLAAALGAIGGIVLAPATSPMYDMGLQPGLKGFVAAVMGGLVSSSGAVVGGLLLGVLENVGAGVTKAGLKDIFAFVVLIVILVLRSRGVLGGKAAVEEE
jgi:branched-chain amino acid transport system permease protein